MLSRTVRTVALAFVGLAFVACASAPRHQGMTADQLWELGQREYADGDLGDAAQTLEVLILTFPTHAAVPDAQLLMARSYFDDERYVTAQAEFRRFLDRYPSHASAPEAALGMCRSAEALSPITQRDQTFTVEALELCGAAAVDYGGTPEAEQAAAIANEMREKLARDTFETGEYYLRRDFHHSAILYFEIVLEEHGGSTWAPRALVGMMEAYEGLGFLEELEETRQMLLERYPDSPEAQRIAGAATEGATRSATGG